MKNRVEDVLDGIPDELAQKAIEYFDYCWGKQVIFDASS